MRPIAAAVGNAAARPRLAPLHADMATTVASDSARPAVPPQTRKVVIDAQSRELIHRVIDLRTGEVVRQFPDAALLRVRAYTRAMADRESQLEKSGANLTV